MTGGLDRLALVWQSLRQNPLRAVISVLAVGLAGSLLIAPLGIGLGARREVVRRITSLGVNLVVVRAATGHTSRVLELRQRQRPLEARDMEALLERIPQISQAAPTLTFEDRVYFRDQFAECTVEGTDEPAAEVRSLTLERGSFISHQDNLSLIRTCVLGPAVAETLFGEDDPLGRTVRLQDADFTVVGVLAPRRQTLFFDYDNTVIIPLACAQRRTGTADQLGGIWLRVREGESIPQVVERVNEVLGERHPAKNYSVWSQQALLEEQQRTIETFGIMLGAIGGISLLVAGMLILITMSANVTERTREIAIYKAVGARGSWLFGQVVLEAGLIGLLGGLLGLGLGIFSSTLFIDLLNARFAEQVRFQWQAVYPAELIIGAVAFAATFGMLFGAWPAACASRLEVSRALRYE